MGVIRKAAEDQANAAYLLGLHVGLSHPNGSPDQECDRCLDLLGQSGIATDTWGVSTDTPIDVTDLPRFRDSFTDEQWAQRSAEIEAAVADEHSHGGTPTLDSGC